MIAALLLVHALALSSSIDDAEAALAAGDAVKCGELAQAALTTGELDEANVARAWSVRARCYTLANDRDRAERSWAVALRVQPELAPPVDDPDAAFAAALKQRPAVPLKATARADADHVAVTLDVDDLQLVRAASLWRTIDVEEQEVARFPLQVGEAAHQIAGIALDGALALRLHDKHGNVVWRTSVAPASTATTTKVIEPSPAPNNSGSGPSLLTTIGAGVIGVGLVGAIASGIGVAASDGGESQSWLVGVGASTGVFLVGAALVVVDQGM